MSVKSVRQNLLQASCSESEDVSELMLRVLPNL